MRRAPNWREHVLLRQCTTPSLFSPSKLKVHGTPCVSASAFAGSARYKVYWMSKDVNTDLITPWFYQFCWGFSSVPAADENREAEMQGYAQALCNAVSGDGTASEAEVCVAMIPGVAFHSQPPRIACPARIAYASLCHSADQMDPGIPRHQGVWKACPRGRDDGEVVGGKADRCYHQGD